MIRRLLFAATAVPLFLILFLTCPLISLVWWVIAGRTLDPLDLPLAVLERWYRHCCHQ